MRMFSRAPFMTHGTLHAVCGRLKTLLRSPEFLQQRVETGLAEHGLVVTDEVLPGPEKVRLVSVERACAGVAASGPFFKV